KRINAALDAGSTFEEKLRGSLAAKLGFFQEHREFFRVYHTLRYTEGKRRKHPLYEVQIARVAAMLEDAMQRGEIRRLDSKRLAWFIIEAIGAVILRRLLEENPPPESADVDLVADTILDGIRSRS